jgi:hypothetical protein
MLVGTAYGEIFIVQRDNGDNSAGGAYPGETHSNEGGASAVRIKASDHQWYGDWDTVCIEDWMANNPCPPGWHYEATLNMVPHGGFTVGGAPNPFHIAAVWSETDWVEGDGPEDFANFNWTNPTQNRAATYQYAQDLEDATNPGNPDPTAVNWVSPTLGACTFLGTFLNQGDKFNWYGHGWAPWLNQVNSIQNSQDILMSDADVGNYVSAVLDAALLQDLLANPNNRGLVVYDLPPGDFNNKQVRTLEFAGSEPYIEIKCVPEPATMLLLIGGGLYALARRKR